MEQKSSGKEQLWEEGSSVRGEHRKKGAVKERSHGRESNGRGPKSNGREELERSGGSARQLKREALQEKKREKIRRGTKERSIGREEQWKREAMEERSTGR